MGVREGGVYRDVDTTGQGCLTDLATTRGSSASSNKQN